MAQTTNDIISQKTMVCLWFNNEAEEAAHFYTSVFRNSAIKQVTHYGEAGAAASGQKAGSVMTVVFSLDGQDYMGLNGGPGIKHSWAVSLVVNCRDQEEIDYFWEKLSEGGKKEQCGWVTDKFGISWQIWPAELGSLLNDENGDGRERMQARLMKMTKLDVAELKRAFEGA